MLFVIGSTLPFLMGRSRKEHRISTYDNEGLTMIRNRSD